MFEHLNIHIEVIEEETEIPNSYLNMPKLRLDKENKKCLNSKI